MARLEPSRSLAFRASRCGPLGVEPCTELAELTQRGLFVGAVVVVAVCVGGGVVVGVGEG